MMCTIHLMLFLGDHHQDRNLLEKLNTAAREGRYSDELWKTWTGTPLTELAAEWRQPLAAGTR